MAAHDADFEQLTTSMKRAAAALRDAEIPFILGGGLACWARGGPSTEHDVDFHLRPKHAEAGQAVLAGAGMTIERPPEEWLLKAYDDGVLIDLIYNPAGGPIDDRWFERAEEMEVMAMTMLVASLEDVLATKLLALNEQRLDYASVLEIARALREQIDWDDLRARTAHSPFASAFFTLADELGISPPRRTEA